MKTTNEKSFDAVKIQREIRDKIRVETENMTYEQLEKYIEQQVRKNKTNPIGQKS
jgi:acid stress-induced BolA-like protein IbaG/YrbA